MLLHPPPPPRRNNGSLVNVNSGDGGVVSEACFTVNQSCPVSPIRPSNLQSASIDVSDGVVVSIRGSIGSTAPVHFHRFPSDDCSVPSVASSSVSMTTMSSFGGSSHPISMNSSDSQSHLQHLGDQQHCRPTMTTFGDPSLRLQRPQQQLQMRTFSTERGVDGGGTTTTTGLRLPSTPSSLDSTRSDNLSEASSSSISDNATSRLSDRFCFDDLFSSPERSSLASSRPATDELGKVSSRLRETESGAPMSFSSSSLSSGSSSASRCSLTSDSQNGGSGGENDGRRVGTDKDMVPVKIVQCRLQRASPPQEQSQDDNDDEMNRLGPLQLEDTASLKNLNAPVSQPNRRQSPENHHYQNQHIISNEF